MHITGEPLLSSGHLAIPRGSPLNRGATVPRTEKYCSTVFIISFECYTLGYATLFVTFIQNKQILQFFRQTQWSVFFQPLKAYYPFTPKAVRCYGYWNKRSWSDLCLLTLSGCFGHVALKINRPPNHACPFTSWIRLRKWTPRIIAFLCRIFS